MSRRGVCVYCSTEGVVTDDHVPPKNLFPLDRRDNLITVPSCEPCNNEFAKNDEYFRLMLAKDADLVDHPEVAKIRPIAFRALDRPEQYGLRRAIERSESKIVLYGPDGGIVRQSTTFMMRLDRVSSVAARITVGLHAKFVERLVGPDVFVGAQRCSEIRWEDDDDMRRF